jgi:hypothetical protein
MQIAPMTLLTPFKCFQLEWETGVSNTIVLEIQENSKARLMQMIQKHLGGAAG